MKNLQSALLASAIFLAFSSSAIAAPISKAEYKSGKDSVSRQYSADKLACGSKRDNAKDICIEEAKGRENIAKAELEASYEPSVNHNYEVRVAKADAVYHVAREKCDDMAGNAKDVCRKEAEAAHVTAKADAKVAEKTSDANAMAREKTSEANASAQEKTSNVRKDAALDKRDAAYEVAKEKCDAMSGDPKAACIKAAKSRLEL